MNFILRARDKTKKYLPISQRIIKYQIIIVYQFMQDQCSHSFTILEERAQKGAVSPHSVLTLKVLQTNVAKHKTD